MEDKYGEMRDKITASKSFKQLQIEQEDEAIFFSKIRTC